jgi:hypothetical protein
MAGECNIDNGRRELIVHVKTFYVGNFSKDLPDLRLKRKISKLLNEHRPGIIRPECTRKDCTKKAVGALGACSKEERDMSNKKHNPINNPISNPIWNPINNPIYKQRAKEAKERLIFGCTLDEFFVLSRQEQQRRLPGFTELSAMTKVVNDARSAEERRRLNRAAVELSEVTSSMTPQAALVKVETQVEEALSLFKWSAENEQAEGAAGTHCCKFSHFSVLAAVGEIATNISERTDR